MKFNNQDVLAVRFNGQQVNEIKFDDITVWSSATEAFIVNVVCPAGANIAVRIYDANGDFLRDGFHGSNIIEKNHMIRVTYTIQPGWRMIGIIEGLLSFNGERVTVVADGHVSANTEWVGISGGGDDGGCDCDDDPTVSFFAVGTTSKINVPQSLFLGGHTNVDDMITFAAYDRLFRSGRNGGRKSVLGRVVDEFVHENGDVTFEFEVFHNGQMVDEERKRTLKPCFTPITAYDFARMYILFGGNWYGCEEEIFDKFVHTPMYDLWSSVKEFRLFDERFFSVTLPAEMFGVDFMCSRNRVLNMFATVEGSLLNLDYLFEDLDVFDNGSGVEINDYNELLIRWDSYLESDCTILNTSGRWFVESFNKDGNWLFLRSVRARSRRDHTLLFKTVNYPAAIDSLEQGVVDMLFDAPPEQMFDLIEWQDMHKSEEQKDGYGLRLEFNIIDSPVAKFAEIRKAVAWSIDYADFAQQIFEGYDFGLDHIYSMFHPNELNTSDKQFYEEQILPYVTHYNFNLEMAQQELENSGWNYNADGTSYWHCPGNIRHKWVNNELVPAVLNIWSNFNENVHTVFENSIIPNFEQLGIQTHMIHEPGRQYSDFISQERKKYDPWEHTTDILLIQEMTGTVEGVIKQLGRNINETPKYANLFFGYQNDPELSELINELELVPRADWQEAWQNAQLRVNKILPFIPLGWPKRYVARLKQIREEMEFIKLSNISNVTDLIRED